MKQPKSRLSIGFLYDDTLDSTDGVAQQVKTLGAWLSSRGHKVSYLVGETKTHRFAGGEIHSLAKNKQVVFNGNRLSIPVLADRAKIKEVMNKEHFDILHVQMPYSPLMSRIVINQTDKSTAIVGTFHIYPSAFWAEAGARLLRVLLAGSLKKFDQIISVSQPAADFAKRSFGISSQIVPNVVDLAKFNHGPVKQADEKSPHIVFLGRLVKRKGCLDLLKAFKLLKEAMPAVRLTIAGDGPQRSSLEQYVRRNGLGKSVKFSGFISEKAKPELLASVDIACFPSLYGESFGIVLLEAMAAGAKVVLGGYNPGYASVLGSQKELLIDPENSGQFAARMDKLLRDDQLIAKLHSWQLAEVKKYDVAVVGPRIEAVYLRAIANHPKSRHN